MQECSIAVNPERTYTMIARKFVIFAVVLSVMLAVSSGCASPQGATPAAKRADVQQMRNSTLNTFFAKMPHMKQEIAEAPGYGVFSAVSTHTIIVSSGNGFGVIRDNSTQKDYYMRAFKLGGGLGAGAQKLRAIVVFDNRQTMLDILNHGWGVTGRAEAAAKIEDEGNSGAVVATLPGMKIYRFTDTGLMLGGAIEGAKIWQDKELN